MTKKAQQLNPRTLSLHLTALSHWHRCNDFPDPTQALSIRKLLNGIQREHGRPKQKAKALRTEHLHTIILSLNKDENTLLFMCKRHAANKPYFDMVKILKLAA